MNIRKRLSRFTPGHNQRLKELSSRVNSQVSRACSVNDLVAAIREIGAFDESLRYNLILPRLILIPLWAMVLLGFVLLVDVSADWAWIPDYLNTRVVGACILFPMLVIAVIYTSKVTDKSEAINTLSTRIATRYLAMAYQIREIPGGAGMQLSWLCATFKDFCRGVESQFTGYKRYLVVALTGAYQGQLQTFAYHYHHLRYTARSTSGGEYELDRYSLTVEFPWIREVSVRGESLRSTVDREQHWKTPNVQFNHRFKLTGSREDACERFIKAEMLECCLALANVLEGLNMEFSATGHLCLSFYTDLMAVRTAHTLHNAEAFEAEMRKGFRLPQLDFTLAQLERMRALYA
ncbi:hypothetical protein IQ22_03970 [Pseudomonas duriflava]|uniref:DUF3137 domain-containing protein n=1 Tax=Pseudomonas duriflava TaxID=459528 RepID=A0A562PZ09_9PSED|nr:hypothetical protein [Pseudomonas duriflava]TWI49647.1 hypothetical protein IQ22_03970 [Pseudomonas duriflava]